MNYYNNCLFITVDKRSPFVDIDYSILKSKITAEEFVFSTKSVFSTLLSQFLLFFKILSNYSKIDFFYSRFADYHTLVPAFFSKFFSKPLYVVLGGSDVNYLKKYNYGNILGPFGYRKLCVKKTLTYAEHLFLVTPSLLYYENNYIPGENYQYGIKTIVQNFKTPYTVVRNSIIEKTWQVSEKENSFITVANIKNKRAFYLKGIDLFIGVAQKMPGYTFRIIGLDKNIAKDYQSIQNLEIYPLLPQEEFKSMLARTKVFCLFSYTEGYPNVVLEAMASGCIPIVSNVSDNYELAQEYGYLLNEKNLDDAIRLCKNAITNTEKDAHEISNFVKVKHHLKKREAFISDLLAGSYRRSKN